MILCQLTDPHIRAPGSLAYGRVDTNRFFDTAISELADLAPAPDAYLLTGDLTDFGRADEYATLANGVSRLGKPAYLLPGNHDERRAMRLAFPDLRYLRSEHDFLQYRIDFDGFALIALDTVVPEKSHGVLDTARLAWLADHLDQATPTIIAMHHPPFITGIQHMDRIGLLEGAAELEALLGRHRNIERIVCGHLHRSIQARFANTFASTCPSPAHQVALDLSPGGPSAWRFEPPGYQLHAWLDGRLVTHTGVFGNHAGPYPFHGPGGALLDGVAD
jgi:3',5'-cyclic AMP phosphodiesterase CpdA